MERISVISQELSHPRGPYSHAVRVGDVAYTAGFGPRSRDTQELPNGIQEQTRATLKNLETALREVSMTLDDVVKVTVYLQDVIGDFEGMNEVYSQFFSEPFPVRTTLGAQLMNILVELDATAIHTASQPSGQPSAAPEPNTVRTEKEVSINED